MKTKQRFSPHESSRRQDADLILYCQDGMLSEGLRRHLLAHSCSLRITTICTEAAFSDIVANSAAPLLVILSGALTNTLMQFRVIHQHQCTRRKQMVLCQGDAYGLRTLLPFFRWFNMHAPVTHFIRNIMIWLAETDRPPTPLPLSSLTLRQREILLRLAGGQKPHYIADRLGISIRTVSTHRTDIQRRLGIYRQTGWTLLCAAIRESDFNSDMCGLEPGSDPQISHENKADGQKNEN
ncbi:helix-turn-helix transcriptional regulator [Enterobacter sp. ASE]|uniref:helix-turn-helix domain-containing protein n=1 Tax=Enterobacter sp. ASE TaxID=2905968 RepID=UPI001E5CD172|nr:helix-turn-helix transcriptional regulator [Enterobacter sp. ASE]MCE3115180.1 helix-turn-helix transcriptional regulator [Enterobacter sp. ASE]